MTVPHDGLLYLDPTTGSIAFQAAIGGVVAGLAVVRMYWKRIKSLFAPRRGNRPPDPPG